MSDMHTKNWSARGPYVFEAGGVIISCDEDSHFANTEQHANESEKRAKLCAAAPKMLRTLRMLARLNDKKANDHLGATGSWHGFEPASVQAARDMLKQMGEL